MKFIRKVLRKWFGLVLPKEWSECTKSSNWHGRNAEWRMMNMLSPHMPDDVFNERMSFIKSRGCNTVHLFVSNKGDGEFAGYCPYGAAFSWSIDKDFTNKMTKRIEKLYDEGFGIVLWLMADDSFAYTREASKNFSRYVKDVKKLGWMKYASTICLGLELDEYWTSAQVCALATEVRAIYDGKIAVHHTNDRATFIGCADLLFYQIKPTSNAATVEKASKAALSYGKPVNMFELERFESRDMAKVAMNSGCYAVGNW